MRRRLWLRLTPSDLGSWLRLTPSDRRPWLRLSDLGSRPGRGRLIGAVFQLDREPKRSTFVSRRTKPTDS